MQAFPPAPPAVVSPAPRPWAKAAWLAQHDAFVARARRGNVDVLFRGDSITEFFVTRAPGVWNREIAPLGNAVDFGISGDRTQFVLWRVRNGELDGTNARDPGLGCGEPSCETGSVALRRAQARMLHAPDHDDERDRARQRGERPAQRRRDRVR